MIGVPAPTTVHRRPERGQNTKPLRCTDYNCPSRTKCRRPGLAGDSLDFSFNRSGNLTCGYYVEKGDSNV